VQFLTIYTQLSAIILFVCACFAGLVTAQPAAAAEEILPSVQAIKLPGPTAQSAAEKSLVEVLQIKRDRKKAAIFKKINDSAAPAIGEVEKKEKGRFLSALLKKEPAAPTSISVSLENESSMEKNQTILADAARDARKDAEKKETFIELVPSLKPVDLTDLEKKAQTPLPGAKKEKTAEFLDLPTL